MNSVGVGQLVAGLGLFIGAVTYLSTVVRLGWQPWILLATFARFSLVLSLGVAVVLGVITRDWPVLAVAAAVVVSRATQWRSPPVPPQNGQNLTVLTANLLLGTTDPAQLAKTLVEHQVDVLLVQELTPEAHQSLIDEGIGEHLEHSFIEARPGGGGTGIWSRFCLAEQTLHDGFWFAVLTARLELADGWPLVCSAHLAPPWPYPSAHWVREMPLLHSILDSHPPGDGAADAVILGADLNATFDHPQFRALLRGRVRDAAAQAGRARLRTWPADRLRPVFGIDHILLRSATAQSVETVELRGSDHLGVLAKVQLPGAENG